MSILDEIDGKILNMIQKEFEITEYPFRKIADNVGISEKEVIDRVDELKSKGYIRRVGGVFDSRKMGYITTLLAMEVDEDRFYETASIVNSYKEITHNYRRENRVNMWFTLSAESESDKERIILEIKEKTGIGNIFEFPAKKFFKLDVFFNMSSFAEQFVISTFNINCET